ncbi:MAG: NAD(P)-dependent oxidoreductase [Arachnia sp.]
MKVLLPDSVPLAPQLPPGAQAVSYDNSAPLPPEHLDADALVVWDYRRRFLRQAAPNMAQLRLVQGLAAGPDSLLAAGFAPGVAICSGVGLHDSTVAEHALGLILALVRRLPQSAAAQADHHWDWGLGGNQPLHPDGPVTTLLDARVLIWGFGSIGSSLAPLLSGLGATVTGVARSAGTRHGIDVITDERLTEALSRTDVLVMILPSTPATERALNADRLAQLNPDAYLVNVGRGSTVDESALLTALREERLAGAALDVTQSEPLPEDSPLWDAPRLLLTPHAAGGRPVGADELITANLAALDQHAALRNVVA